jgi:hypothetical protein
MPTANVNGRRFYYEQSGSGPDLVLIMGHGLDHTFWEETTPGLSASTFDVSPSTIAAWGNRCHAARLHDR